MIHQTPIPTVGLVVLKDNEVLLVRHSDKAEHLTNTYGLPSGRIEAGETPKIAAKRELFEETGLVTSADSLIELPEQYTAEIMRKDGTMVLFSWTVFLCRGYSGELVTSSETYPEWLKISEVGKYNLLPNVEKAIEQALQYK